MLKKGDTVRDIRKGANRRKMTVKDVFPEKQKAVCSWEAVYDNSRTDIFYDSFPFSALARAYS